MKAAFLVLSLLLGLFSVADAQPWKDLLEKGEEAMEKEDYTAAIKFFDDALKLEPNRSEILGNRGKCYSSIERWDEALRDLDKSIERKLIEDGYWETQEICFFYFEKAFTLDRMTRHSEAIPLYEKVIALDKNFPYAHNNLAWIMASSHDASLRNPDRAIELVKVELNRLEWKDPASLDTLAGAYAAKGSFEEAVQTMMKVMEMDIPPKNKKEFEEHLELFRNKKTFVQTKKDFPVTPKENAPGKNQPK